jgi:RimJ/RimL family protein N-acetyltransferase
MIKFELSIRDIQESDALEIYRWRNDPITIKHSKTGRGVELEEHTNWLENLIAVNKGLVQIAVINERPIGIILFTSTSINNLFEISINISPEFRKQGLGKKILSLSEIDLVKKVGKCTIRALVLANNKDSMSFFVKCKYEMIQKNKDSFIYEKKF